MQKIEGRGFSNLREWRRNFGPGEAGRRASRLIIGEIDCEFRSGCTNRAVETVDYDVFADLDQKASCSKAHSASMRRDIDADLALIGRNTAFGKNGWGRA